MSFQMHLRRAQSCFALTSGLPQSVAKGLLPPADQAKLSPFITVPVNTTSFASEAARPEATTISELGFLQHVRLWATQDITGVIQTDSSGNWTLEVDGNFTTSLPS